MLKSKIKEDHHLIKKARASEIKLYVVTGYFGQPHQLQSTSTGILKSEQQQQNEEENNTSSNDELLQISQSKHEGDHVSVEMSSKDGANKLNIDHNSIESETILLEAGTVVAYERIPLKELCADGQLDGRWKAFIKKQMSKLWQHATGKSELHKKATYQIWNLNNLQLLSQVSIYQLYEEIKYGR
ncbi:hypothetical protein EB796_014908 [Bugula neritina]|uniref:Uncharacterized protein n=1 Tax=Bugula neritina TaxID=10212 RepID=A0A7J7JL16_BUGNE|nr:hypothetical protein EB796_014908 [Bugula neritina]